jgi:hypothetical protein
MILWMNSPDKSVTWKLAEKALWWETISLIARPPQCCSILLKKKSQMWAVLCAGIDVSQKVEGQRQGQRSLLSQVNPIHPAGQHNLLASTVHEHPDVLYAKKVCGELGSLKDGCVACSSYNKAWITLTESYKAKLTKELRQFCTWVKRYMPKGVSYHLLVISLLGDVKNKWYTLCSFINLFSLS